MIHRLPIAALVLAGAAAAQCQPSSGIFAGIQASLSLDEATAAAKGGNLYLKDIGFLSTSPTSWPATAGPDFAIEKAFRNCGVVGSMPDVDALTLGMDIILADDATGKVFVPQNPPRWGAITFSVTRGTKGAARSVINGEATTAEGAAGDIFTWMLPGSAVPSELIKIGTQRAQDSREIDLGGGTVLKNLDAVEHIIPMYRLEPLLVNTFLPKDPTIYFSVSKDTINRVPVSWWGASPPSGASIFQMTWDPLKRVWSCPKTFMNFKVIGLLEDEDIDALSLDFATSRMLFSTKTKTRNPILFRAFGALAAATIQTYTDPVTNKPVSDVIGLITPDDDVDAICALDPSVRATNFANPSFFTVGTPRPRILPGPWLVNSSAIRGYTAGVSEFRTYMTGWPATGAVPGFAMLFVTPPDSLDPLIFVELKARNPASTFCGDPLESILQIPKPLALQGLAVNLRWFAFDANLRSVTDAHPLLIRL